jgi:hypothetical protein
MFAALSGALMGVFTSPSVELVHTSVEEKTDNPSMDVRVDSRVIGNCAPFTIVMDTETTEGGEALVVSVLISSTVHEITADCDFRDFLGRLATIISSVRRTRPTAEVVLALPESSVFQKFRLFGLYSAVWKTYNLESKQREPVTANGGSGGVANLLGLIDWIEGRLRGQLDHSENQREQVRGGGEEEEEETQDPTPLLDCGFWSDQLDPEARDEDSEGGGFDLSWLHLVTDNQVLSIGTKWLDGICENTGVTSDVLPTFHHTREDAKQKIKGRKQNPIPKTNCQIVE